MKIVLDSTELCSDFLLTGTHLSLLLTNHHLLAAELCIPQVVIDETVNRHRQECLKSEKALERLSRDFRRLTAKPFSLADPHQIDDAREEYRALLVRRLAGAGVRILDYPEVSHQALVERDLAGRKPFSQKGGYRDALIWENVRRLGGFLEPVYFVTANHRDFGGPGEPHEELRDTATRRVRIYPSVRSLNEELLISKLEVADRITSETDLGGTAVITWLNKALVDVLEEYELGPEIIGFPHDHGSVSVNELTSLDGIELLQSFQGDDGHVLIRLRITAEFRVGFDVSSEDWLNSDEIPDWFGPEEGPQDVSGTTYGSCAVEMDLLVDRDDGSVFSSDLLSFDSAHAHINFG